MKQSVAELLELVSGQASAAMPVPAIHRPAAMAHHRFQPEHPALPQPEPTGIVGWNEARMGTGVPSVDAQHQELIRRINELHADCVAGKAREQLMEHLNFLGSYAQSHFSQEEKIMEEHRCPARGQNQAAHAKFLKDYGQLVALVNENGASTKVALHLKQMLGDWLTNHICRIDAQLRHCPAAEPPLMKNPRNELRR